MQVLPKYICTAQHSTATTDPATFMPPRLLKGSCVFVPLLLTQVSLLQTQMDKGEVVMSYEMKDY